MTEEFIPCTAPYLPEEQWPAAAAAAIEVNPANRPDVEALSLAGMVLPPGHLAALTGKYWGKSVRLTVGFLEQISDELAARILYHANAWADFCNVEFVRTRTDPQVRITRSGNGYWSYLGTDILQIPRNEPTMCLQAFSMGTSEREFVRVVRHEFGHTLAMPHEHARRDLVALLDEAKTIAYFGQTQGWSPAMVRAQVLTPLSEASIMGSTEADPVSLMCYQLPGSITKNGKPIPGGSDFSLIDRQFAAKLYPKADVPPPPKPDPPPKPNPGGPMTREQLRAQINSILSVAEFLAKLTPTPIDNNVVAFLQQAVQQDWVLDLILKLLPGGVGALSKDNVKSLVASL